MTRRRFGAMSSGALASLAFGGACHTEPLPTDAAPGRLTARPRPSRPATTSATGTHALGLGEDRDAILHVPPDMTSAPYPLAVLFHGAGSNGARTLDRFSKAADAAGVAVLAPDSRGSTWDAIRGGFGRDVAFLDRALAQVFQMLAVDPDRLTVGGFSDGATYALSLGLVNGDLFPKIAAFSPGFIVYAAPIGKPRLFVSHGIRDEILPIDRCSRQLVPALEQRGYDVTFREFEGGHEVPAAIAAEGMHWIARSVRSARL